MEDKYKIIKLERDLKASQSVCDQLTEHVKCLTEVVGEVGNLSERIAKLLYSKEEIDLDTILDDGYLNEQYAMNNPDKLTQVQFFVKWLKENNYRIIKIREL